MAANGNRPLGNNVAGYASVADCADVSVPDYYKNTRYVGIEAGEVRIDLVASGVVSSQVFTELRSEYDEADPKDQEGLFSNVPVGLQPQCDDELRFCHKHTVGTPNSIRVTVENNDPVVLIKAEKSTVNEGQPARFIVEREWSREYDEDEPTLSETVVALRTTIDGEYVSTELPTIVTLQRDETRKVIELATVHDSVLIENGSVTIELLPDTTGEDKNARGKYSTYPYWKGHTPARKRSDQATVTISNIDTFPGVFISDTRVAEDAGTVTLSVKLTSAYSEDARVSWANRGRYRHGWRGLRWHFGGCRFLSRPDREHHQHNHYRRHLDQHLRGGRNITDSPLRASEGGLPRRRRFDAGYGDN